MRKIKTWREFYKYTDSYKEDETIEAPDGSKWQLSIVDGQRKQEKLRKEAE